MRSFHKKDPVTDTYLAFSSTFLNKGVEHVCALNYFSFEDPASYSCHVTNRIHHKKHETNTKDDYLKSLEKLDQYGFVWV